MGLIYKGLAACAASHAKLRKISLAVLAMAGFAIVLSCGLAIAAVSGRLSDSARPLYGEAGPHEMPGGTSGLPARGVIDCLLYKPGSGKAGLGATADIHINYPSFGNKMVDQDIREWVTDIADAFAFNSGLGALPVEDEAAGRLLDSPAGADVSYNVAPFELWGAYRISRPSAAAVSIAFEIWNYTGNPEGNLDIITLNYSLLTGQRLSLVDIFEKPDIALKLMSSWSRKVLDSRLGSARRARMLTEGTEPLPENFSSLTLTPEGICINFQPWQVAPKDAGIQRVTMPLEELLPSSPLLALWGRGENEQTGID